MKKIIAISLIITITLIGVLSGCSNKPAEIKNLRFGLLPAESAIPFIVAKEEGFFEEQGLNVELTMFISPNDRNVAVQGEQIDGTVGDVMTAFAFNNAGINLKIVSDINEDFKIISSPNSGVTSVKELDKKDISLVPNFVLEYIMDKVAEKNEITYNIVDIPSIPARFEALINDKVTAVVFTEPQATQLKDKGANIITSSKDEGIKAGAVLMNQKIITDSPEAVKAFYKAYNQAVDFINNESVEKYGEYLSKYNFADEIKLYLGNTKYEKASIISSETFEDVLKWSKDKKLTDKDYKYEDLTNFTFIK